MLAGLIAWPGFVSAQDDERDPGPDGQFLTLHSPIDDNDFGLVTRWALKLQAQAEREKRPMVLVLEIPDGASRFHQVYGLCDFLTSNKLPDVTVIAWVPRSVSGHNVLLALSANEIVIAPEATLGDLGRGKSLEPDDRDLVFKIVERGRNPFLNKSIARALMELDSDLQQVKVVRTQDGMSTEEMRFLSSGEIRVLQEQGALTPEVTPIKTAGAVGKFEGRRLKQLGLLVSQLADSRNQVATIYQLPREALEEPSQDERETRARLVRLEGVIDWESEFQLMRQIERALDAGCTLLIVEIDSPGGLVSASENLVDRLLEVGDQGVRTVAYVPRQAISGGGLVALACDEIYMHADALLGDIGPIEMREGGQIQHADEKMVSYLREIARKLAEKKGRPPALLMSMIDKQLPVYRVTHRETGRVWFLSEIEIQDQGGQWIKGGLIDGTNEGSFLTVDGKRAADLMISEAPVDSLEGLVQRIGLPPDAVREIQIQWLDKLLIRLNSPAAMFLLFFCGIAAFYLELHLPSGIFGMIAALCFVVFFWSRFMGGTAGWLEVMLFILGIICVMIELFLIPGVGFVGFGGAIMIIASLVMASQTFNSLDGGNVTNVLKSLGTLFGAGITVILFAVVMSNMLPKIPLFSHIILTPPGFEGDTDPDAPRLKSELFGEGEFAGLLGSRGASVSLLKPYGKARINGQVLEVVSDGPFIDAGSSIEVIEVSGRRIVVKEVS
jgi:membrane-bound serine protease (ClpP class)